MTMLMALITVSVSFLLIILGAVVFGGGVVVYFLAPAELLKQLRWSRPGLAIGLGAVLLALLAIGAMDYREALHLLSSR